MRRNKNRKKKVAVFDVDGTIFRSSLLIEFTEALVLEGVFPENVREVYSRERKRWLERKGSYRKYIMAVVAAFYRNIKGVKEKDFLPVVTKVAAFHRYRLYRYTRDLMKNLKKRGYFLLAISHSPTYIAREFGKKIGFDKVYGHFLEMDGEGRFTGTVLNLDSTDQAIDKAMILRRAVQKENLTLKGSVGVGDTESDIPFLKLVEKPICFNPNIELYRTAKKNKWRVVVERKDMIYKL